MNIILNITECCTRQNCCVRLIQKQYNLKNITDTVTLCNGYILSILSYNANSINIKLEKGNNIYIRTMYISYPFEIRLNSSNICYTTITISSQILS